VDPFESISDRRIQAAREAGLFDNLPGAGKPIPDLDRRRPAGWWAERKVSEARDQMKAEALAERIAKAMPAIWRLKTEDEVVARVQELNAEIEPYNRYTRWKPVPLLNESEVVARWRELSKYRQS